MNADVIIAVAPELPGMSRIADALEAQAFLPGRRALSHAIAGHQGNRPLVAVLPSTSPQLILQAARSSHVARVAVYHAPSALPAWRAALTRAAFALVDLTIAEDESGLAAAVRAGADPDRVAIIGADVRARIMREPRRGSLPEAAASLALDAADASGLITAAERLSRGSNVVNYHRVLPVDEHRRYGRPQMALAEPLFAAQMEMLAEQRGFAPVDDVRGAGQRVSVTFDDGYEDNYRVAFPVLRRFGVPASIFVVTAMVGQDEALWWDRLGRALFDWWNAGCQPELTNLLVAGLRNAASATQAQTLISGILGELNEASDEVRQALLQEAEKAAPGKTPRTMLSWDEVKAMAKDGIRFGSHTKNHVVLDQIPAREAADELYGSQADLERELGDAATKSTALPRGVLGPFTEDELAGRFDSVMTTEPRLNRPEDTSVFIHRRDGKMLTLRGRHHPAKLRLELTGWLDALRR